MFPFQIDLSKLSYPVVIDIVAPFVPGGIVGVAWAARQEAIWNYLHDDKVLKLVIGVFGVYVVGFVILHLSQLLLVPIAYFVLVKFESFEQPWKDIEWRKLASAFLGPNLSPPIEVPPQQGNAKQPGNAEELQKFLAQSFSDANLRTSAEIAWQKWYDVLKICFPPVNPYNNPVLMAYAVTLHSIGWAGPLAIWIYGKHVHWAFWVVCPLVIAAGLAYATNYLKSSTNPDPSGYQLSAQLLRQIKNQQGPK